MLGGVRSGGVVAIDTPGNKNEKQVNRREVLCNKVGTFSILRYSEPIISEPIMQWGNRPAR